MIRQYELVENIRAYNPNTDETLLNKAYIYAMRAHGSQKRANGDPYFSHPIEVAAILTKLKLDDISIVTALLHDTVEDTNVTKYDIEREFGAEVAMLVDGVTKLTKLELAEITQEITENTKQAENFRKLLLAIADDIRVLLVKLADRLHNMRTLNFVKNPESRMRIARETQELYAPLAGRVGVQFIREELEDLSFSILNPDARDSIVSRMELLGRSNPDLINDIECEIQNKMAEYGIESKIYGRLKTPYSIFEKMRKQSIAFEQLADVIGFRVIVGGMDNCYKTLGVIHQSWTCIPGRFKDYISMKKRNGYQSIHTTVMIRGHKVEMQIRTQKMHDFAEHGVAAHWGYKQNSSNDTERYGWVRELIDYMQEGGSASDLLEYTKMEIFHDKVFCFTPKGRIIRLPRGATAIDFAYGVHSDVGDKCVGVNINGVRMPLRTALHNGDTVSIITSPQAVVSPAWEEFVTTGKARNAIRRSLRNKEREEFIKLGRSLLQRQFAFYDIEMNQDTLNLLCYQAHIETDKDLFYEIGHNRITPDDLIKQAFPDLDRPTANIENMNDGSLIPISGLLSGMAVHLPVCCSPLPGDRIVGLLRSEGGVNVHAIDCAVLEQYDDYPELWIDLKWDNQKQPQSDEQKTVYTTKISVYIANQCGALGNVTTLIGRHGGNIININGSERKMDYYCFVIDLEVYDLQHLQNIFNAVRLSPYVSSISRIRKDDVLGQDA